MEAEIIITITGIIAGFIAMGALGWLIGRANRIGRREIDEKYVVKQLYEEKERELQFLREDNKEKAEELILKGERVVLLQEQLVQLEDRLLEEQKEIAKMESRLQVQFENLANRILEEKSRKFTTQNQENLKQVLDPLKERIQGFEQEIQKKYIEDNKERASLKTEINHLMNLNQQLSQDASNLVNALRGENKIQGNWGELRLELILESAGLQQSIHFRKQAGFQDEEGRQKQPDFIIHLPENKHLIIDSKVSLIHYEKYFSANTEDEQKIHLEAHLRSIRKHIKDLSGKNYQELNQLYAPDYAFIYIPIEHAYILAVQKDPGLFIEALEKNIVLVSGSTLLATMRTVSFIWRQEKQKANALEIAKQSGMLYDKFVAFVEDMQAIGQRMAQAQGAYDAAMNKLSSSARFGSTLIGRAEKLKSLGARTSRELPPELVEKAQEWEQLAERATESDE